MRWGDLKESIADIYDLDEDTEERLVLQYHLPVGNQGKTQCNYITSDSIRLTRESIERFQYKLMVRFEKGDERTVDCSCDSDFMLKMMPQVGNAIRQRYRENGVSDDVEIILVMDNAGGHGKNDVVEKYKRDLLRDYNVRIWHQQPRTPESNMLDLGVWMHVQSKVKEEHFGMRVHRDVLWKTMQDAWWKHMKQQALTNVLSNFVIEKLQ
jgi:hypothetical protein